jgi:hypothetical protein
LFRYLRAGKARRVVIAFDNEEKSDPRKKFQPEIWARFLAKLLDYRGFDAFVASLPAAWRDEKHKRIGMERSRG